MVIMHLYQKTNEGQDYGVGEDEELINAPYVITSHTLDNYFCSIIKVLLDLDLIPLMSFIKEGSEITILPILKGEKIKRVNVNIHGHFGYNNALYFTNFNILKNRKFLSYISKHEYDGSIYKVCHKCYEVFDTDEGCSCILLESDTDSGIEYIRDSIFEDNGVF